MNFGSSKRLSPAARARFLEDFCATVDPQDLAAREPQALAAIAASQLGFARRREPGAALVRVFNPTLREDGYSSPHTVVEMVGDDMPFLVDSIGLALTRRGLALHFLAHPIFAVVRDRRGILLNLSGRDDAAGDARRILESFQHVEVDRIVAADALASLRQEIERNLADVRVAYTDWPLMQAAVRDTAQRLSRQPPGRLEPEDLGETRALLAWMVNRHFTFLGYREYRLRGRPGRESLTPLAQTGLGILSPGHPEPEATSRVLASDIRRRSRSREIALVTKANIASTVHRAGYLDYVGVKVFAEKGPKKGRLIGERRFLGLWTSAAYNANPREIPLLKVKVARLVEHFDFAPDSHDGKTLQHILESFPRDELFQASLPELIRFVTGIFGLQERPRVRFLARRDPFRRFYSCLVYVPREKYNTQVRERIEKIVAQAFGSFSLESQVQIAQSNLARIHIVARTQPSAERRIDAPMIERQIAAAVLSWNDSLKAALLARLDEAYALRLNERYGPAFPAAYVEDFSAQSAAYDISFLEALDKDPGRLHLDLYRSEARRTDTRPSARFFLKIYRADVPIPISDLLPMLENMGLRVIAERPYQLDFPSQRSAWIQDLELELRGAPGLAFDALATAVKQVFIAVWTAKMDSDSLNRLALSAGVPWRQVNVLRAYCRYLLQTGLPFSQGYIADVLAHHASVSRLLAELFVARFSPATASAARKRMLARLNEKIGAALEKVEGSDEDRILRAFWSALGATVRTSAYRLDGAGQPRDYLSFKIESQQLRELPLPKPLYEIFVFSARMEGVHLRMGRVARGGIRWSDRREDFRTEILGLMKAQNVKNTVIVPVGAKGGFVLKNPAPTTREALQSEVVACYQTLIRGLLDLTDNIEGDAVVPPPNVVRHDADDPYLVVAADKGTATFSDIANAISAEFGFWLGDAFASGGSAGYDHKKMAITARGAWKCVQRHFRESGNDIEAHDFSVVGIGDMAGDVFGNGMLQSTRIRLVAAFNHQHIFIDPDPHAARSFAERLRLYRLPGSTWEDYSRKLISRGGGVFSRRAKTLTLSREAQEVLGVPAAATPNEVIKAILCAPVDLLWNGGIGTYVKASDESHGDVGDRGNDAVRVDASSLRCKIIGEGGNLGLSQRGRIEYARRGGRLNTDFIDNSGGVNCSDVEVNLKILLNGAVRARELSRPARDRLLAGMTDEVAGLVLRNNVLQSQAISLLEWQARQRLGEDAEMIRTLERSGDLNRALEFLPGDEEIAERRKAGAGLTRPELAIVLSYGKIWTYKALIQSDVPEDSYLSAELTRYFPEPIRRRFPERIKRHRLRREIIATAITNSLINRMGPVFPVRTQADTGADPAAIARGFTIAREVLDLRDIWTQVEALSVRVASAVQYAGIEHTTRILRHLCYWLLTNQRGDLDIDRAVARFRPGVAELLRDVGAILGTEELARFTALQARFVADGLPAGLAARIASLDALHGALDLVEVAAATRLPIAFAARAYYQIGERLGLAWLKQQVESLPAEGHWHAVARGALRENLYAMQRKLAAAVLACPGEGPAQRVAAWVTRHAGEVGYLEALIADLRTGSAPDFATLSVALHAAARLAGA
jgi:glutamate dehydrogenase